MTKTINVCNTNDNANSKNSQFFKHKSVHDYEKSNFAKTADKGSANGFYSNNLTHIFIIQNKENINVDSN